jgi:uncharacterized membrane protein
VQLFIFATVTEDMKTQSKPIPKPIRLILLAMPLIALIHMGIFYGQLPEKMASHFGPNGEADGYMSKLSFGLFYVGIMAFVTVIFAGMGTLLRKLPSDTINLPNREHWLAPERKETTLLKFGAQMNQFGVAACVYLVAIMHLVIQANISGSHQLGGLFLVYLTLFIAFTGVWVWQITRFWQLPKEQIAEQSKDN